MKFVFAGQVPSSKSLFNRCLILQAYQNQISIQGRAESADVSHMQRALREKRNPMNCGEGGTSLRFLLAYFSRQEGHWELSGSDRLLQRPHDELLQALNDLGAKVRKEKNFIIEGREWSNGKVKISQEKSSQFLSAIFLNSCNLKQDLLIERSGQVSDSYLQMTLQLLKQVGIKVVEKENSFFIERGQIPKAQSLEIEADMSTAFHISACAIAGGYAEIQNFPEQSLQGDFVFVDILKQMGAKIEHSENLKIFESRKLNSIEADLIQCPDLFPSLAVLCSLAKGESCLSGLKTLEHKESNRLKEICKLFDLVGISYSLHQHELHIQGKPNILSTNKILFDPKQDHRLAMAASIYSLWGIELIITKPHVVEKSFSSFWNYFKD